MNLRIRDILNADVAFGSEQGRLVREAYFAKWQNEPIVVDFQGVRNISPSFLSQALMPILEGLSMDDFRAKVQFISTPEGFDFVLQNVLKSVAARKLRNLS